MKPRLRHLVSGLVVFGLGLPLSTACRSSFEHIGARPQLVVQITGGDAAKGTATSRQPIPFDTPTKAQVKVLAIRPDGSTDTSFNGFVRASAKPGTVVSLEPVMGSAVKVDGRNVQLMNGEADVVVDLVAIYGNARLWFEDIGYTPADPASNPPPQCSNGVDDNNNGLIDYPNDPGCAYANDNTEEGGTFGTGVSDVLFFTFPRIADVRGVNEGGTATSFPHEQTQMDTGYDEPSRHFNFSVVVTRIASSGFYVTDIDDARGFASVYAYTYSAPPFLRVCDRLKTFAGTASDFYGFTEIGFPTWLYEPYEPQACAGATCPTPCNADTDCPAALPACVHADALHPQAKACAVRHCMVPDPYLLTNADLSDPVGHLFRHESELVAIQTAGTTAIHVGKHFGPGRPTNPPNTDPTNPDGSGWAMQDGASNCDLLNIGKVNFNDPMQAACQKACDNDVECSEYSNYLSRTEFKLVFVDGMGAAVAIQANANAAPEFDPLVNKGKPLRWFAGVLSYFSGGSQFTIEARCADDIVLDLSAAPLATDIACVRPRTILDNNEGSQ